MAKIPEPADLQKLTKFVERLHDRWTDEKDHEDWTEYVKAMQDQLDDGYEFVGAGQRPFHLLFNHGPGQWRIKVTRKRVTVEATRKRVTVEATKLTSENKPDDALVSEVNSIHMLLKAAGAKLVAMGVQRGPKGGGWCDCTFDNCVDDVYLRIHQPSDEPGTVRVCLYQKRGKRGPARLTEEWRYTMSEGGPYGKIVNGVKAIVVLDPYLQGMLDRTEQKSCPNLSRALDALLPGPTINVLAGLDMSVLNASMAEMVEVPETMRATRKPPGPVEGVKVLRWETGRKSTDPSIAMVWLLLDGPPSRTVHGALTGEKLRSMGFRQHGGRWGIPVDAWQTARGDLKQTIGKIKLKRSK